MRLALLKRIHIASSLRGNINDISFDSFFFFLIFIERFCQGCGHEQTICKKQRQAAPCTPSRRPHDNQLSFLLITHHWTSFSWPPCILLFNDPGWCGAIIFGLEALNLMRQRVVPVRHVRFQSDDYISACIICLLVLCPVHFNLGPASCLPIAWFRRIAFRKLIRHLRAQLLNYNNIITSMRVWEYADSNRNTIDK